MKKLLLTLLLTLFLAGNCFAQPAKISAVTKVSGKELYKVTLGADNDEVVIGDEKNSATFKNQITFKKWFNEKQDDYENSLSIIPPVDLIPNATVTSSNGQVLIRNNKIGFYYNKDPTSDDNFKFGLILYEKPLTNTWSFQLEGWEEFDFFYQPPLANTNPDGSTWESNASGGRIECLAKVAGSYAVYHKTKVNHIIGQKNYGCGKFGHIFRPRLLDADGNFVCWVDLHIEDGIYTITTDQNILDTAKYPLKFNDWFGTQGIGGSQTNGYNEFIVYLKAVSTPASNGTLTSLSMYGYIITGLPTFNPALYSDTSSYPNARLVYLNSGGTVYPETADWVTTNLSYASIVSGTQYWLGFLNPVSSTDFWLFYDNVGATEYYDQYGQASWVDPASGGMFAQSIRISIYATYTPSGGAAATGTVMMVN